MKKNTIIILVLSYLICLLGIVILLCYYEKLPHLVPIHTDFKGEIDFGEKANLFIFPIVHLSLLLLLSLFINKPELCNYPVEITNENKAYLFPKMQHFLAIMSLMSSIILFIILLDSMMFIKVPIGIFIVLSILFIGMSIHFCRTLGK